MKNGVFRTLICLCACSMMLAGCTTSKDAKEQSESGTETSQVSSDTEATPTETESGIYVRENKLVPADKVEEYLQSHEGTVVIGNVLNNSLVQNGDAEVAEGVTEVAQKFINALVSHDSDGVIDTTDIPLLFDFYFGITDKEMLKTALGDSIFDKLGKGKEEALSKGAYIGTPVQLSQSEIQSIINDINTVNTRFGIGAFDRKITDGYKYTWYLNDSSQYRALPFYVLKYGNEWKVSLVFTEPNALADALQQIKDYYESN